MPDSNWLKAPILHVHAFVGECYYWILTSGGRVDVAIAASGGKYSRREMFMLWLRSPLYKMKNLPTGHFQLQRKIQESIFKQ